MNLAGADCMGCGACASVCHNECIQMIADKNGFLYPQIQPEKCIQCNLCKKVCPLLKELGKKGIRKGYAALSINDDLRMTSSSGGLFGVFAQKVIAEGGVVFGAGFDDEFNVCHYAVEDEADLDKVLRSKYVQSNIKDCYKQAKSYLDAGKGVLFCGTPCQIGGLRSYLRYDYDNLIAVDFICHGVPSPKAWKKYLEEKMKQADAKKIKNINFRSKESGWRTYSIRIEFDNDKVYSRVLQNDSYMKGFLQNIAVRESCFGCKFKGENTVSDITLGDLWGVDGIEAAKQLPYENGISAVAIHTEVGEKLFEKIKTQIKSVEIDERELFLANSAAYKSVNKNKLSKSFFKDLDKMSFDRATEKYCGVGISAKIRRKLVNRG